MNEINITSAQYLQDSSGNNAHIRAVINGQTMFVPTVPDNTEYAEIMRQVEAGELTIADAE